MPASKVREKINAAKSTLENTSPAITMPFILAALDEIANVLEELEKQKIK